MKKDAKNMRQARKKKKKERNYGLYRVSETAQKIIRGSKYEEFWEKGNICTRI